MKSTGDRELDRELKERTDFEESNYVRVTLSKAQKKKMKQAALNMQRGRKMDDFDEYDSLTRLVKESEKITSQVIDEDELDFYLPKTYSNLLIYTKDQECDVTYPK